LACRWARAASTLGLPPASRPPPRHSPSRTTNLRLHTAPLRDGSGQPFNL
jgi:hypothetical protein